MKNSIDGCFHKYIYNRIKTEADKNHLEVVDRKWVRFWLYTYSVPKPLHETFMKEMQQIGLVKKLNRRKIKLN